MLTRIKSSLTMRIFCVTGALLIAACGITYAAIAYLTPISYTSLLADELKSETNALIERLCEVAPGDSESLLVDFARRTSADMRLMDEYGSILYDTLPSATSVAAEYESAPFIAEDRDDGVISSHSISDTQAISTTEDASSAISEVTVTQDYPVDSEHSFTFSDGTSAFLTVRGGARAVNQAAEAMKRILPYLLVMILATALLGSFFYARFITKPIVLISRIAKRIAALDFGARWKVKRSDEIGALGSSLNLLSDNLSETLSKLEAANVELQRDIERERELDRQRLAFFSAASHELKTPVTILKGQLSGMLAQVGVYRDREKYLARALEVTGRMEGLIKEILTISRIESGSCSLDAAQIDLGKLVEKQLSLDEELIGQKQLSLDVEIEPGVMIEGNENLLSNAIDNVLTNATLYSPAGATIRVRVKDRTFSVENTGTSIPEEALPQLFTPFYRVEQSRNRKLGGSGLGLYLVKSVLDLHGASCRMENAADGVLFTAIF